MLFGAGLKSAVKLQPNWTFYKQMFLLLLILAGVLLQKSCAVTEAGVPEILNNGTLLDIEDNDIAHITCATRSELRPVVRWEKEGIVVQDKDKGVAILTRSNGSVEESHLFVAVTGNNRRGEYICVVTNEKGISKQSFRIKIKGESTKLSRVDIAAICISVGISLLLLSTIGFFLWRGAKRKRKLLNRRERARRISQCSQENGALIGDSPDTLPTKEYTNGIRKSTSCMHVSAV